MRRFSRGLWFALLLMVIPATVPTALSAQISFGISVHFGPPAIPVYSQPVCPGPGYLWTPGYWAWGQGGYYWVPGAWVLPPQPGLLWTPGYWGWRAGVYVWHAGYWGPQVGFYGGINYGFGYPGRGYYGGYWRGDRFFYNRDVDHLDDRFHDVYYRREDFHNDSRVSFNGGRDGVRAWATPGELRAQRERRFWATRDQQRHMVMARANRGNWARFNHGRPAFRGPQAPRQGGGWRRFNGRAPNRQPAYHGRPAYRGRPVYHGRPAYRARPPQPAFRGGRFQGRRPQPRYQARGGRRGAPQRRFQARGGRGGHPGNRGRGGRNHGGHGNGHGHGHRR